MTITSLMKPRISVASTRNGVAIPESHEPYTDKYFLRTNKILKAEGLNPYVRAQVFIRKGPGIIRGIDEAVEILREYGSVEENGGRILALQEGSGYRAGETLQIIEGRIQDFVELETMYLGVISGQTTLQNDRQGVESWQVTQKLKEIVEAAEGRPVSYFGARHWHYIDDARIAGAAYRGGATSCSTDIGAAFADQEGIGTIPHVLENIVAYYAGKENAVVESTKLFDKHIDPGVPRVALIDYNNKEVDDAIATANALEGRLAAVRIDTCGENLGQGAIAEYNTQDIRELVGRDVEIPQEDLKFWFGNGVTVTGTYAVRRGLDRAGHKDVGIMLTSGFGNVEKVKAFSRAEKILGSTLYDGLGVGGVYEARSTTMDVVAVGDGPDSLRPMAKTGRKYNPSTRLQDAKILYGGLQ